MKRKWMFMTVLFVICTAMLFGAGTQEVGEKIVLNFGHGHAPGHSFEVAMDEARKMLEEETDGRITIKTFPSAQLGNERQMQEQLTAGTLDLSITGVVNLYDPAVALFDFPFLYDNRDQIRAVMYSEIMDEINQGLIEKGIRIVGLMEVGFRNVTSNKPIRTPNDLRGFKIRTPESPAQVETFRALGANPTPMSFNELYSALQQGVVDGQENPLENIYNGRFYEVQDYVSETRHIFNFAYALISEKTWQRLSPSDRELVAKAVKHGALYQMDWAENNESRYKQMLMDEGMQFLTVDRDLFREASAAAYRSDFVKGLGERGQHILEEIRRIVDSVE